MIKRYIIAYYGNCYSKMYANPSGWQSVSVGKGIIHESPQFTSIANVASSIEMYKPDKPFDYAKIEERYYDDSDFRLHHE